MIQIQNLTITHNKDNRVILDDFNLVLNDGDKAVIIGEEGNGKSTLLKWIYAPALIDDYAEAVGRRILNGNRLGYLPQELDREECEKSLYEFFQESEKFFEKNPKELSLLANKFNVSNDFYYNNQLMKTLSGGEKIKAQLMRILMDEPTVLLLDEPSNDIDLETLDVLERIINDFKTIVLFISHDEVLIENTANVIVHLEQIVRKTKSRTTVKKCDYQTYIQERNNAFEKQKQIAISDKREKKLRDERYQRVLQSVDHALNTVTRQDPSSAKNLKDKMHTIKAMGKRFEKENEKMAEMPQQEEAIFLTLGNANTFIPNGKTVLDFHLPVLYSEDNHVLANDINLCVHGPSKVCIIGNNGVGKTTLLKIIHETLINRNDIKIGYMPQNYEDCLNLDMTPVQFLADCGKKEKVTYVRNCLGSLKYTTDEMEHAIRELSGGQKAKLFLLKIKLENANVLLLDEPTRNFSPLSNPVIRKLIKEFKGAVISVSHDRKYISEVNDVIYRLSAEGLEKYN